MTMLRLGTYHSFSKIEEGSIIELNSKRYVKTQFYRCDDVNAPSYVDAVSLADGSLVRLEENNQNIKVKLIARPAS